jgi:hypothetical protein
MSSVNPFPRRALDVLCEIGELRAEMADPEVHPEDLEALRHEVWILEREWLESDSMDLPIPTDSLRE